jgi:hypothetical protein
MKKMRLKNRINALTLERKYTYFKPYVSLRRFRLKEMWRGLP